MNTTHVGKIGRLPKATRDLLGNRLEDNVPGIEVVAWLNGLPEVQAVLQGQFAGRAITEQNLSDWKQSGHREWVRQEEAKLLARSLAEGAEELHQVTDGKLMSDGYAGVLAAELVRLAGELQSLEGDAEVKWRRLEGILRQVSRLRRDDHRAAQLAMAREQHGWTMVREELAMERATRRETEAEAKAKDKRENDAVFRQLDYLLAAEKQSLKEDRQALAEWKAAEKDSRRGAEPQRGEAEKPANPGQSSLIGALHANQPLRGSHLGGKAGGGVPVVSVGGGARSSQRLDAIPTKAERERMEKLVDSIMERAPSGLIQANRGGRARI